jgi:predicted RNA-binding Zn ribbon-like protein
MSQLTGGGSPVLGEPLAIEFANTRYAIRGHPREGLGTVDDLVAWLRDIRPRLLVAPSDHDLRDVSDRDLWLARELRDTVRGLAESAVSGGAPAAHLVETLNRHTRRSPHWRELQTFPEPGIVIRATARPVEVALAELADSAVAIFGGQLLFQLRACPGPGCVLYFLQADPRREWCSAGCGNRARAARHYSKLRQARTDRPEPPSVHNGR